MLRAFARRRSTQVVVVCVLVLLGAGVAIHTPAARRAVLARAIAILQDRLNIELKAGSLRYNLFALRVTLTAVDLSSIDTPDAPFVRADTLIVDLPWSALYGPFSLERVALDNARVRIVRYRDGRSNLPPSQASTGEPAPIPIGRLTIPRLSIDWADESADVAVNVPALAVDVGPRDGVLELTGRGAVRRGTQRTEITGLGGGVSFDGRKLALEKFRLVSPEIAVTARGTVTLFDAQPGVDLELSGTADVDRSTRWAAIDEPRPQGTVTFDGTLKGPMSNPALLIGFRSDRLSWQQLTLADVKGDADLNEQRLLVRGFDAGFTNGRVSADADVALAGGGMSVNGRWADLDTNVLARALGSDLPVTPAGRASGTVSLKGSGGDLTRWEISASNEMRAGRASPNTLPVSGTAKLETANGNWRLVADQRIAGTPLHANVNGRLNESIAGSSLQGFIRVDEADLSQLLASMAEARLLSSASEAGGTLRGEIDLDGTLGAPRVQSTFSVAALSAGGLKDLSADLTASGTSDSLAIEARVRQDPGNTMLATGTIFPRDRRLDVRVTGRLEDPSRLVQAPVAGTLDVEFEGSGPFDAIAGNGSARSASLSYDTIALGAVESTVELGAGTARVRATLSDFHATADARIGTAAPYQTTAEVRVDDADLETLLRSQKLGTPLTGVVSLTARGAGPLDDYTRGTADVEITKLDARSGDLQMRLLAPGRAAYRDGIVRVTSIEAAVGETHVSVAGDLPILERAGSVSASDALRATLTGDLAQALEAARAAGFVELPPVSGRGPIALLARVTGSAGRPAFAADLELGPGSAAFGEWPAVDRLQLRAHLEEGRLELSEAAGEWQGAQVTANGRLPIRLLESYLPPAVVSALPKAPGGASLTAKLGSLTPRVLEPFLDAQTVAQLEGTVDASLQLETPSLELADLTGEMRLDRLDLRIANLPVTQREPTRIVAEKGFARVAAWDWAGEGATLAVQGRVNLNDQQAALQANGRFDLRMLSPFIRDTGLTTTGLLEPRISIGGPIRNPTLEGQLALSGGEARLASPRVVIANLEGRVDLSQTTGRINSLTGTINGGALNAGGTIDYGSTRPMSAEFTASVQDMALNFPEGLRSELGADVTLRLSENTATDELGGTLAGTVTIERGSYREPMAVATALLTRLRTARLAAAAAPEAGSLAQRLALNVRVVTEEEISVDNNYGRLALGGDLRLIGTAAAPSIAGRAILEEGGQLFLGRNIYTVGPGATIDFANPTTIEPNMNITANTRAGGHEIELTITGTPANLNVEPRAVDDPQLGVADVWSLLLTGRTLDEVTGDEAEIVGEQVLGYVSGDVLGIAGRAVGIESVRLGALDDTALMSDPTLLATEVDPTSRLTFGQSIGDNIDLTFSQNLRDGDAQTWIVDYSPLRQLSLRYVQDDANLRSYQFRHDVSFGDQARPATKPSERRELKVTRVDVTGTLALPERRVRDALGLNPGDTFDFVEWQRDRDKLEELYHDESYREARIDAQRADGADGVSLSYRIEAGPRTVLMVSGYELPRRTISAIESAWNGTVFDGFLTDDATAIARRALAESGYLRAEVGAAVSAADGVKTLSISIAPGTRSTEFRVQLEGVEEPLARELDRWMRDRQLDEAAWRDPDMVENAVAGELRSRGHLSARVSIGAATFDGAVATLPLSVEPGPVFTVSEVSLQGARTLYDAALNAIAIEAGAPYDPAVMDAARDRVAVAYRRAGFGDVRVTARPDVKAGTDQVALVFEIEEGPRQVLQEVSVRGNRGIDTDVVTRAVGVKIGDPVGPDTWLQARSRVFETGLFRRVDLNVEPAEPGPKADAARGAAGEAAQMRMNVIVQEWPRLRMRYGFAVEEQKPDQELEGRNLVPGLSVDVIRRTLFGRAVSLAGAAEYQRRRQAARGTVSAPTFMSLPIASSVTLERSREEFADASLVTATTSVSWEQRFRLARRLRLSYSYSFERNRTYGTGPPDPTFGRYDVTVNVGRFTGTAAYDTRDNVADTTRGWLLSSSTDYAPKFAGNEFVFVRQVGQAYYFKPWRGTVLASAARIGLAFPLQGQDLIPSELFFLGGARSVRGVSEDGLGPTNFLGEPLGGEGSLVFNQEIRVPLFWWFRGVGFVDAGNVFPQPSDIRLGDLKASFGVGLRLATPFALLRVDYGRLFSPGSTDRTGRWTFGLGHTF